MTKPISPLKSDEAEGATTYVWSRRSFLTASALGVVAATFSTPWSAAFAGTSVTVLPEFHGLSEFLTAKQIDTSLSDRALSALCKVDDAFPQKAKLLNDYIRAHQFPSVDALSVDPSLTPELKSTAMAIISSYYLGYAGTAQPGKATDNTQFVTYTQALMYRLTYEYTPIPSYSRWGTGYWVDIPRPS